MKLLYICHYDDNPGECPRLVEIPDAMTADEGFLEWIRRREIKPLLTMKELQDKDCYNYAWGIAEVKPL